MNWLLMLIIIGIFITAGIMLIGVASMSQDSGFNKKYGNKLMQARVLAQFITLILVVLYLYLYV
ncbi:MAG: hypothetical protein COB49_02885 [Alphaproteobacteria bacterium]|nr:MAG: hypothetical protein COB49_02885 [Alphaproteobacteria bacterium]